MAMQEQRSGTQVPDQQTSQDGAGVMDRTSDLADSVKSEAKLMTSEVAAQAKSVAQVTKDQVGDLARQTANELRQQADDRGAKAAAGLRTFASQVDALAEGRSEDAGQLMHYLQDGQQRITSLADRIEQRGPQGLVEDLANFGRRRHGLFLLCAAGAGMAVGRLARASSAGAPGSGSSRPSDWQPSAEPAIDRQSNASLYEQTGSF